MEGFSGAGAIVQSGSTTSPTSCASRTAGIIDGYVVGEPSGYPLINSQAAPIAADDPRQAVIPPGVPVVKLHSAPEPAEPATARQRYTG